MTTLIMIAEAQKAARQSLLLRALKLFMVALVVIIAFKTSSSSTSHHSFHNNGSNSQEYSDELQSLIAIIPRLLQVISIRVFADEIGGNPDTLIIKSYSISNIRRPRGPPYSV